MGTKALGLQTAQCLQGYDENSVAGMEDTPREQGAGGGIRGHRPPAGLDPAERSAKSALGLTS